MQTYLTSPEHRAAAAARQDVGPQLFQIAEIAKFTPVELREYEDSLKTYRDLKNSLDTAEEKGIVKGMEIGRAEGRAEEKIAIAQKMKSMGFSAADISEMTGLPEKEIDSI